MSPPANRGLGRGLGALIPPRVDPPATAGPAPSEVPVDRIRPNPQQPRARFEPQALEALAQSIREHGVLQPLLVERADDGGYQLLAGERRWRAARLAGLASVPVVVKAADTPRARLELALVENLQRLDLNALEEAYAYKQLVEEHGLTQEAIAARVGKSRVAISNTLRLLQAPPAVQRALAEGQISEGHARAILGAPSETTRLALLRRVVDEGLSVRQTEALVRSAQAVEPPAAPAPLPAQSDPDLARLEDAFRQALGTRVQLVRRGPGGGRLVVHFHSDDELQGLYERIAGDPG